MPPILFPSSTAPGKDAIESAGRLVNCYAEKLQPGGPSNQVIRRTPGLTPFCTTAQSGFRGMWYDGNNYVYAAWENKLYRINSAGTETQVGSVGLWSGRARFLTSLVDTANLTAYTYSAVDLGAAHFNRRIVVAVIFNAPDDYPPASVTIGGVAASLVISQGSAVALYSALVPLGTTGNIVVTYASAANLSAIGVWRLDSLPVGSTGIHATHGVSGTSFFTFGMEVPVIGTMIVAARSTAAGALAIGSLSGGDITQNFDENIEATRMFAGAMGSSGDADNFDVVIADDTFSTVDVVAATWGGEGGIEDHITFAKNNKLPTPDQVLVVPAIGAHTFTTSLISFFDINSEVVNSVCFGEGYFFFTAPSGRCYASAINDTTVNSLDSIRAEQRPEALVRGVFYNGELYLWGRTHCEVWASRGNPNATGFPLNYVTSIWRGLVGTLAIAGFEEGFEGGMFWVADDNSVRMLQGYQPKTISTPALERAIEACTRKANIRVFCYDVDGHAAIVIDLNGEGTWVYDITEGGLWHERDTADSGAWRATGNSVRAFGKWLVGDHDTGNLYQVDEAALDDGGEDMPFIIESIAMEAFPARLKVSRAEFNFVSGVGNVAVPNPEVEISWSDTGGHRWTDGMTRKLGEDGRYYEQIRINGLGMTGIKGRRFRLRVDDEIEVGLLAGSMDVATL